MASLPDTTDSGLTRDDEREVNVMLDQAMKQIERGMSSAEAVENILALLPAHLQSEAKRRLNQKLEARKAKTRLQPAPAKQAVGLKQALTLVAQKTVERIVSLLKSRPEIQRRVMEAGQTLLKNGVAVDMVKLSETDLGHLPPSVAMGQTKTQETQR